MSLCYRISRGIVFNFLCSEVKIILLCLHLPRQQNSQYFCLLVGQECAWKQSQERSGKREQLESETRERNEKICHPPPATHALQTCVAHMHQTREPLWFLSNSATGLQVRKVGTISFLFFNSSARWPTGLSTWRIIREHVDTPGCIKWWEKPSQWLPSIQPITTGYQVFGMFTTKYGMCTAVHYP